MAGARACGTLGAARLAAIATTSAGLLIGAAIARVPLLARQQPAVRADAASIEAWLHAGRFAMALSSLREAAIIRPAPPPAPDAATAAASRDPRLSLVLLAAVLTDSWNVAAALAPDTMPADAQSDYWFVRGMLAARAAWPGGRQAPMDEAREAAAHLEALAASEGALGRSSQRRALVLAAMAGAQEERDQLALLLAQVEHVGRQLDGAGVGDDPLLPAQEGTGDLWLQVDRYEDAMRAYERVVTRTPSRTRSWIGLARAADRAGRLDRAREAARQVLTRWAAADPSPILNEMRRLAGER